MIWLNIIAGFVVMFVVYEIAAAIIRGFNAGCLKLWELLR